MAQSTSTMSSGTESQSKIQNYDENRSTINSEKIYRNEGEVMCHYKTAYTYTSEGYTSTETHEVLEGDCSNIVEDSYQVYSYDNKGRVNQVKSFLDRNSDDKYTTLKVIESYTNDLE